MNCPKCGSKTEVEKTIIKKEKTFRYRRCKKCGYRFKTVETISDGWDYKGLLKEIKAMIESIGL